ncbi:MAG: DUF2851 family protein [Akkermansiaceae bacterium]
MCAYEELLQEVRGNQGAVSEQSALTLPGEMHLQALWFAGQMGREFETVDGKKVSVVQFGHWNHGAGPDFLNTAVEIDGELHHGPLELEHSVADWESHGHSTNPDFDAVILHVVFVRDGKQRFTRTVSNRSVPQVVVSNDVLCEALQIPVVHQAAAHPGRCFRPLADMHDGNVNALMLEAVKRRVSLKASRRAKTIDALGEQEWLWQAVAETLGYRPNKLAMTLLAQRLPISELKNEMDVCEAILFGAAGFLTAKNHDDAQDDSRGYLRDMWEAWWRLRDDYEPSRDRSIPWKLSGIRPVNHPQRRVACLAQIARHWKTFRKACRSIEETADFFRDLSHSYWSHHYTVKSKRSDRALALMGKDRLQDLQINHLIPARLADGNQSAWEYYLNLRAPALSEKVDKASVRLFGSTDRRTTYLRKAWQHQALLQIYQDFCLQDVSDCEKCPFPEQLAQWRG